VFMVLSNQLDQITDLGGGHDLVHWPPKRCLKNSVMVL
jgi:hypothetical protein